MVFPARQLRADVTLVNGKMEKGLFSRNVHFSSFKMSFHPGKL